MTFLDILDGPSRGRRFSVVARNVTIGRGETCNLQILDELISRRHLGIRYDPDRDCHWVIDVGSANGVTVNGVRLVRGAEQPLQEGDEIRLGQSRLRYTRARSIDQIRPELDGREQG